MKLQKLNIRGRIMNIAKWRYKLEIFKVKKFLCVMMLFVLAVRVAYSENVGQETKTINNMPAYLTIGTNLLYWAALAPNVTAEYYFPDSHWSISGTFTMPWWKRKSKHQYYQIRQYLVEGRYWLNSKPAGRKHFLGANIHGGIYDLENKKTGYYGEFIGTSLTYGYSLNLNGKMSLEFTIGGGYIFTNYDKYLPVDNRYVYQSRHKTHYWGVTKAGITLIWNILYQKR